MIPVIVSPGFFCSKTFKISNRLAPFVGSLHTRNFDGQMTEPAVLCCSLPVFYFRRDINAVA